MPVYELGGLVRLRYSAEPDDWDVIGLILEMRHMDPRSPDARVLWNDMPNPSWVFLSDLVPMQPDGDHGTI